MQALKNLPGLDIITDEEARLLESVCKLKNVSVGTEIMREGEEGNTMYLFLSGVVDVTKALTLSVGRHTFKSAEKSFVKLKAGETTFFGEMAMLEDVPRAATVTAATDCSLYELSQSDFAKLCETNPPLGVKLLRIIAVILSRRVRKENDEVLKLSTALSIALSR